MAGYIGSKASVVSSGAERKKTFTITGATTSLTGLNYTVGKVHVFQNGVRLVDGTDYTATNGTSITLTVAAQSGDNVVVISQAAFQVADALLTSGGTMTGDLSFGDNDKAIFGAGDDLQIYHDGTHSYLDNNTGALFMRNNGSVVIEDLSGDNIIRGIDGGAVDLYHNGSSKLTTTSTGVDVTGNLVFPTTTAYASANSIRNNSNALIFSGGTSGYFFNRHNNSATDLSIDSSGAVTKPNQPAFHVTKGTNQSPIGSTINVEYTVVWASEKYDIGGNFSGSQFTAPVAGKYVFQAQTMLTGTETQGNYYWMRINTSNGNIGEIQSIKYASNPTYLSLGSHCIVDMDVGDTASVGVRYGSVVGSNPNIVVDDSWTWFMGYLLG